MGVGRSFTYEFEYSPADASQASESTGKITTIKCHGDLVVETKAQLEEMFKATPFEGRIVMDLGGVNYLDSAGLGALMRLKLSASKQSGVSVKYVEMTPRVKQLLSIANLTEWFSS